MKVHPERIGGTINADFQASMIYTASSFYIGKPFGVHNACKDFRPSEYWVCIRMFCPRVQSTDAQQRVAASNDFVYLDARHFGLHTNVCGELSRNRRNSTRLLRDFMAHQLRSGPWTRDALWDYAIKKDLPRIRREMGLA